MSRWLDHCVKGQGPLMYSSKYSPKKIFATDLKKEDGHKKMENKQKKESRLKTCTYESECFRNRARK